MERQDADALRGLAAWKDWDLSEDEIRDAASEDETVADVQEGSSGTIVTKKIPCGKDCSGCPHGPYEYRAYRDGD